MTIYIIYKFKAVEVNHHEITRGIPANVLHSVIYSSFIQQSCKSVSCSFFLEMKQFFLLTNYIINSTNQNFRIKWLPYIIRNTFLKTTTFCILIFISSQEYNWNLFNLKFLFQHSQPFQGFKTIHLWHVYIKQDYIRYISTYIVKQSLT